MTEELKSVKFTVVEMLDSEDPASGELVQACKCLRHELNRSDDDIKTIQFISNCLVLILQCFDCTHTFVEPQKFTQIRSLINTLSYELKTQGLEASQELPTGSIINFCLLNFRPVFYFNPIQKLHLSHLL